MYTPTRYGQPGTPSIGQIPLTLTPQSAAPSGIPGLGGGGMDPATIAMISGGAKVLGGLLGGDSPSEKAAMMQAQLAKRAYEDQRVDQGRATGLGEARLRARQMLMSKLMNKMGGMEQARPDLSGLFSSRTNPFGGGLAGSQVVSSISPIQFSEEELGTNVALPDAPKAQPRGGWSRTGLAEMIQSRLAGRQQ